MSAMKISLYLFLSSLFSLLVVQCKEVEILEPSELMYDAMTKQNDYTKEYRILKKKKSEEAIMVSLDSLGFNYLIQARYVYDNEEVNAKQEYAFSSLSNHLFLTDNLQRSPATNKTLIQLYQQSTLIGYELKLSVQKSNFQSSISEFEYQITYYREEDIDLLDDGTSTKFLNMFSGDSEWRKILFPVDLMEMMIFTLENAYEIELYMYSQQAGNLTSTAPQNPMIPSTVSKYSLKNLNQNQVVMILLRRNYNMNSNTPNIIDFNLSIISIYSKNYRLSVYHNNFANFDVVLPIFNIAKILNKKKESETKTNQLNFINQNGSSNNQTNQNNSNSTTETNTKLKNEADASDKSNNKIDQNIIEQNQSPEENILDNNQQSEQQTQLNDQNQHQEEQLLRLSITDNEILKNVMQYEILVPVYNYSAPFYLGSISTSCNAYMKYKIRTTGEEYSNTELQLTEDEVNHFTDKYGNIDQSETAKILIKPHEYMSCKPNCQIHAMLHIEILVDPQSDFNTFKIQGSQIVHDISNPAKPFFDYLPLLSYTFFKVEVPEDLNQLTIQYFSGYQHCYLMFSHSHIPPSQIKRDNEEISNVKAAVQEEQNEYHSQDVEFIPNESNVQMSRRFLQYNEKKHNETDNSLVPYEADERPVRKTFSIDTFQPSYQSGQMIIKPAKKGIHIFSTLNISPIYSPFTIQVNSFNLRQMTNSSYISITLNGIYDVQSLYYDKTHNRDNQIFLQFCSELTDVAIYASTCLSTQNITSCPIPSKTINSFHQNITAKNASIPDLCPNQMCHILFTVQYTPFTEFKTTQESVDNSTKKFSVTLIEYKDETSKTSGEDDSTKSKSSGQPSGNLKDDESNYKWIIIACCILLAGIIIASGLICYIKMKQNKILREMKRQNKELQGEDEEEEEDDDDGIEFGQEFRIMDEEANRGREAFSITEDLLQERTTTNSTQQNIPQNQFYD